MFLFQHVLSTTSSLRGSVWMIVPTATLPARTHRSVCIAMLIVPLVTGRALMTAMCVVTRKLSVTMESVWLSVPTALTMTRLPMNAEVGKVHVYINHAKIKHSSTLSIQDLFSACVSLLFIFLDCDRSCLTCSGHQPSSCLSCDTHRRRDASGHCVWFSQCSLRSYMDHNGQCQECHKLCHRCSGPSKDRCLSCNEPHFLMSTFDQ